LQLLLLNKLSISHSKQIIKPTTYSLTTSSCFMKGSSLVTISLAFTGYSGCDASVDVLFF